MGRTADVASAQPSGRALLVLGLGLIVTAGLWFFIKRHEQQEVDWATRMAAESFRADIVADVGFETAGLLRLATLAQWIDLAEQPWRENAELFMKARRGCIAVEVLTPTFRRRSIVYAPGQFQNTALAFGGVPVELLKEAAESNGPVLSTFIPVDDRNTQRVTVVPFGVEAESPGFVVAFFDVNQRFDGMLSDVKNLGYSMMILERGREQYRMAGEGKENEPPPHSTETAQAKLPGVTWEIRVWPQAATLHVMETQLPELTLVVGVLISFLLTSTVHFSHKAKTRSQNLHHVNGELLGEIRQRKVAEEELHRAQAELEARVQQGTAELLAANAKLEHEIVEHARAEESLQKLTGQLFQLQDEERRKLARELHDGASQNLIALAMNMASMRERTLSPEQQTELLEDSVRLIQQSLGELRTTSHLLHPPLIDELGLPVTLRSYVDGFSARSGILATVVLDAQFGRLARDAEIGIFRVVQESLANVHRHSHSETAKIILCRENSHIRLEIGDQGTGIPPDILSRIQRGLAGVGIAGMRERVRLLGGRFEVDSGNTGTTIRVLLPVAEAKPSDQPGVRAQIA